MKSTINNFARCLCGLALGVAVTAAVASAQTASAANSAKSAESKTNEKSKDEKTATKAAKKDEPTQQTVGDDAGNFTIVSSIEFGYRGQRVDGDVNKYKSDLNYKAGPRLFDTSFLMKSKTGGKGELFDTMLITSTGWGADASGAMRFNVEKPELYRFEGTYRRFKYYRFLNNLANPNWPFSPIATPANPVTGTHSYDTYTHMGDFDLTLLPKNETIRFTLGYSPERYSGPAYTTYHFGGNDFVMISNLKSRANDYRIGADGKLGPIDWTFMQGFRRFRDDSTIDNQTLPLNVNFSSTSVGQLTSFLRQDPTRGNVNYTRGSIHAFINNKLDITGRIIYSKATATDQFLDSFSGININLRISNPTFPPVCSPATPICPAGTSPNTTNPSSVNIAGNVERPNTQGDIGVTYLVTDRFRLSNTFRVEDFTIDGVGTANNLFSVTRPITGGTRTDINAYTGSAFETTEYRKYQNTIEGDYQFTKNYSAHFGYRYGHRHDERSDSGVNLGSNGLPAITATFEENTNNTHAVFGGFRARPSKNFTLYFDAERGTADNVFTRIGNYEYTNVRAKSRWAPNRQWHVNLALILRDNSNPGEINGISLQDFDVKLKTRVFTSSVDWSPNSDITVNAGYNYNWVNSDATIHYYYNSIFHPNGQALYYQRLNHFFADVTARLHHRVTLFASFRVNDDGGQGNRVANPLGGPAIPGGVVPPGGTSAVAANQDGTLITSYPMTFLSPEARLAIRLNRHLDWNLGYQYYAYNESDFLRTFPGSVRAQNYHAHLPYMSLRIYIGRKE